MPRQGTKGGAMASRGRKEGEGMVAAVLLFSAALSKQPLAVSSDTGQVFYGSNGVNGSNGRWLKPPTQDNPCYILTTGEG